MLERRWRGITLATGAGNARCAEDAWSGPMVGRFIGIVHPKAPVFSADHCRSDFVSLLVDSGPTRTKITEEAATHLRIRPLGVACSGRRATGMWNDPWPTSPWSVGESEESCGSPSQGRGKRTPRQPRARNRGLRVDPVRRSLRPVDRYLARLATAHTARGSVISPYSADAATVYGDPRYTWASGLPMRPG